MNDAPFAAAHGIEVERGVRALHLFGGGQRAHAQFFDAQQPVVVGVE